MVTIRVKSLGLAAYIKMHGANLLGVEDKHFVMESEFPEDEWRRRYANSESMRHDSLVCELRHFLKKEA